jgi:hypothetical protein
MLKNLIFYALLAALIGSIAFAALRLFPEKLKLLQKYGMNNTNDDLIELAKQGNNDVQKLLRKSRITLSVALVSGILLVLINHFSRR